MNISKSKIMDKYAAKRAYAKELALERKKRLYDAFPDLKQIDDEISSISIMVSRKILANAEENHTLLIRDLDSTVDLLKARKAKLLTDNSLPVDYADVGYTCVMCCDTGYLPDKSYCNCYKKEVAEALSDMSNISKVMAVENFSTFDLNLFSAVKDPNNLLSPRKNMQNHLETVKSFIKNFDDKSKAVNLLFFGDTGLGKTFMCNAVAKELIDSGRSVVYQTSFMIIDMLEKIRFRRDKFSDYADEQMQLSILKDSDLLIIDDLGVEISNSFTNAELFNIINTRILNSKSIIISTNLTTRELVDRYPGRISSRIFGAFNILKFYGKDLRWENKGDAT